MATYHDNLFCRYRYDPLDCLVANVFSAQAPVRRFYQKDCLVTEIQGDTMRSVMQYEGQLLAEQQSHEGRLQACPSATDLQRSVLSMLDATQPRPLVYTPYGHSFRHQDSLGMLGFTGERPDLMTGHYLLGNGHRAFNPVLMRFNSPDSLSPFGKGGLNAYAYCSGDPVNRVDPSGQFSIAPFFRALRGVGERNLPRRIYQPIFGVVNKPIDNFRKIAPGISVFKDAYKNGRRLNIQAHGQVIDVGGGTRSYMFSGDQPLNPEELFELLTRNHMRPKDYDSIRLISCHLADADYSFAAGFSHITGRPVKAFSGEIRGVWVSPEGNAPVGLDVTGKMSIALYKKRGLGRWVNDYKPQVFRPVT
ncbi:RHS repeat-associated core domain-containing protein [Pseudomonas sp. Pseusp122]|uniref:RHS repeat-associated core domain-containing protein n=1 Tax=unclassified Pseudomonas TaxID=196821 RepID=UPI0039A5370D